MKTKLCLIAVGLSLLAACTSPEALPTATVPPAPPTAGVPAADMPNPASAYCQERGFKSEIRTAADGSQSGVCVFPDGTECDEWAFFRGECGPGSASATAEPAASPVEAGPSPTPAAEFAADGWRIYRNEEFGYRFDYPPDAQLVADDNPLRSLSVVGPVVDGESWPQFTISHPADRDDYRPPEDVDLETWLIDHDLLGDERQPDVQIAGTTAIHVRFNRSPQSYAYDRYFLAKSGQLYMIVIGHTGDKEDWELYNRFLQSIQFEQ
jgi:putative hemolysin